MKKNSFIYIVAVILIMSLSLCVLSSCSKGTDFDANDTASGSDAGYDSEKGESGIGTLPDSSGASESDKIIKTADATVETADYDEFMKKLGEKIKAYGAYTDAETYSGSKPYRKAYVTVRIPSAHFDSFRTDLNTIGILTYFSAEKENVSLAYATLVAKIDTLTLEVGVVEELFDTAKADGDLTKIADLEERLTELKLELAESRAQVAELDNQIAYSTVRLTVSEREIVVIEEPEKLGAFARIGENLKAAFKNIGNFFVEFFVFIVSALPYLLVFGGIIAGIIVTVVVIDKKRKKK